MAEYRLAPAAEHDLESVWSYTMHQWAVEQATRYFDELIATFTALSNSP